MRSYLSPASLLVVVLLGVGCAAPVADEPPVVAAESDILASKTTVLPNGVIVTTKITRAGVRLSTVTDGSGLTRWVQSDGKTMQAFDGVKVHQKDLTAMSDSAMKALEQKLASRPITLSAKTVEAKTQLSKLNVSVRREIDSSGHTVLVLEDTAGSGKWVRADFAKSVVHIFDGKIVRTMKMPESPAVPRDLDAYNRSIPSAIRAACGERVDFSGCGGEGGIDVPDGNWGAACDEHDACYDYSGTSKSTCDAELFWDMVDSGPIGAIFAPIYWLAVTLFGDSYYKEGCNEEACYEDGY